MSILEDASDHRPQGYEKIKAVGLANNAADAGGTEQEKKAIFSRELLKLVESGVLSDEYREAALQGWADRWLCDLRLNRQNQTERKSTTMTLWKGLVSIVLAFSLLNVVAPVTSHANCSCFRAATRSYISAMRKCTSSKIRRSSGARTACAIRRIIHTTGGIVIGGTVGGPIGGGIGGAIGAEVGQARCESYIRNKVKRRENSAFRTLSRKNKSCADQGIGYGRRNSHDRGGGNHV